ncbi:class I SAM-dependent methyltransferase [Aliivibrio fischeri]
MNEKLTCLICDSSDWHMYCEIDNGNHDVLICKQCSFCQLSPIPTKKELDLFYASKYRDQYSNQNTVDKNVISYEQQRADRILKVLRPYFSKDSRNILDIGCSSGTLLKNVATLCDDAPIIHGIEMNDNYRKYIIKEGIASEDNISNQDIGTYYLGKEGKFDFISIVHVLEHLQSPGDALYSIRNLLSDKGKLYIEVPNMKTPYAKLVGEYFILYHLYYFTGYTLEKLLNKYGFNIIKSQKIANTSVCFICEKGAITEIDKSESKQEFQKVLSRLMYYKITFPIRKLRPRVVRTLNFLGVKELAKSLLKRDQ